MKNEEKKAKLTVLTPFKEPETVHEEYAEMLCGPPGRYILESQGKGHTGPVGG